MDKKLDGWGEIAAYLNRSIRTAHRWNKESGLPVHIITHGRKNVVYALQSEIDEWIAANEEVRAEAVAKEKQPPWVLIWAFSATVLARS